MKQAIFFVIFICIACISYSQKKTTLLSRSSYYDQLNNKPFEALELEDTSGNIINTASLAGKTIYVDFWFTACAPCIKEIPHSKNLKQFFANDTNVVFLNICIENIQRKDVWKQMVRDKEVSGINLFYALNRPQKVNLLREYRITFPTYLVVDTAMKVIGYDVPRPSEKELVYWMVSEARKGNNASVSIRKAFEKTIDYKGFMELHQVQIQLLNKVN